MKGVPCRGAEKGYGTPVKLPQVCGSLTPRLPSNSILPTTNNIIIPHDSFHMQQRTCIKFKSISRSNSRRIHVHRAYCLCTRPLGNGYPRGCKSASQGIKWKVLVFLAECTGTFGRKYWYFMVKVLVLCGESTGTFGRKYWYFLM